MSSAAVTGRRRLTDGDRDGVDEAVAPGPDLLDGGGGRDTLSYRRRTAPVAVDLLRSTAGEPAEHDVIRNVESVEGGRGDDRLAGDDGVNEIRGRQGRDTLIGRDGDDFLFDGGALSSCGAGEDAVVNPRAREYVKPGCESVYTDEGPSYPAYPTRIRRQAMRYVVHCPRDEEESFIIPCAGSLTLRQLDAPHRLLAAGSSPTGRWENRSFRVLVTEAARRLATARRGMKAIATVRIDGAALMRWVVRLKLPR
jgi:hypothetical protein